MMNYDKQEEVSLPYRFTLLSNDVVIPESMLEFHYPIDLHYSQTDYGYILVDRKFHYPIDLHYSQTEKISESGKNQFHYPIDLHYSQTSNSRKRPAIVVKSIGLI